MVWVRGSTCYIKRELPGLGKVIRSLGTANRRRGRQLEDMVLTLHGQGRFDLVRAFANGELEIERLAEAYESGCIHELTQSLRQKAVPLGQAAVECLALKEGEVADKTLKRYAEGLDHFMRLEGRDTAIQDALTTDRVKEFKAERRREGAAKETVNNDLGAVSVLVTYCVDKGWVAKRPRIVKYKSKVRIRYLEPDQIRLYMAAVRQPFRLLFQVLIGSGMRYGEAASLRICDLRFGQHEARALIEDSKTPDGVRTVFLPAWVAEGLREEIAARGLSGVDRMFTIPYDTVYDEHDRACKLAGIHHYNMHDHRHTAAVSLARAGMPLHLLAEQLGHTTIQMTMRYAKFNPDYSDVSQYFERVAESFGLSTEPSGNRLGNTPSPTETGAKA